jgi:hypothetical protein
MVINMEPKEHSHSLPQLYAKIQCFYDFLCHRKDDPNRTLTYEEAQVDNEIDLLIHEYSKIFGGIIYE